MCPRCDENIGCKYWDLKQSCQRAKVLPVMVSSFFVHLKIKTQLDSWQQDQLEGAQNHCLYLANKFFTSNAQHM